MDPLGRFDTIDPFDTLDTLNMFDKLETLEERQAACASRLCSQELDIFSPWVFAPVPSNKGSQMT